MGHTTLSVRKRGYKMSIQVMGDEVKMSLSEFMDLKEKVKGKGNKQIREDYSHSEIEGSMEIPEENLELQITNILRGIGIPAHIRGYRYLRSAIMLCVHDERLLGKITKELYPTVARNYETTSSRVERSIRHAIEVAWMRGNQVELDKLFIMCKNRPTNSEFMATIVDDILLKMEV
jgi:two-component system, response regulator, stage 0 sporulation protein A